MILFISSIKLSNPVAKHIGDEICVVEPDPENKQSYLIFIQNAQSKDKTLFGRLSYAPCSYNNYLYTIIIGRKLYKVRSCDLKDRRLAIVDTMEPAKRITMSRNIISSY
jgi:hypothetical protein